jgi:hypothetical protein
MRKRHRVLFLLALVAGLVVPVGYALSVESPQVATHAPHALVPAASVAVGPTTAPIVVGASAPAATSPFYHVPDAAKLVGIGAVLFGLAAAVRKAV